MQFPKNKPKKKKNQTYVERFPKRIEKLSDPGGRTSVSDRQLKRSRPIAQNVQ